MKKIFLLVLAVITLIGLIGCQNTTTAETPLATPTNEPTATSTPVPTATSTPVPTATNTPEPTATSTPEPTATSTPEPTATSTPVPTATSTPEPTATSTPVPTATSTPVPTATSTPVPTATSTPVPTATPTPEPKVDASVALSQYTEDQLLEAFIGKWRGISGPDDALIEKDHFYVEYSTMSVFSGEYLGDENTRYGKFDIDWVYEGVVVLDKRDNITFADSNLYNHEIEKVDGVWMDVTWDDEGKHYNPITFDLDSTERSSGYGETSSGEYFEAWYDAGVWTDGDAVYDEDDLTYMQVNEQVPAKTKALKFTSNGQTFYIYAGSVDSDFTYNDYLPVIEHHTSSGECDTYCFGLKDTGRVELIVEVYDDGFSSYAYEYEVEVLLTMSEALEDTKAEDIQD